MLVLTIRTDKPEAEIGLFETEAKDTSAVNLNSSDSQTPPLFKKLAYETWHAHRELSVTLHAKIETLLAAQGKKLENLEAIVGFAGPGSFTGLRIGLTVTNALAYGLQIPVVATQGEDWIAVGLGRLARNDVDPIALPEYGAPANITQQKK